jgi:serine protease Do
MLLLLLLAATPLAPASPTQTQPAAPADTPTAPALTTLHQLQQQAFRRAAERIAPSVVTIQTIGGTQPSARGMPLSRPGEERTPGGPRRPRPGPAAGSDFIIADGPTTGLIWSADGLILTSAFNFVRDPSVITVILPNGHRFVGELLARDEVRRLAMVKIEATGLPVPEWVTHPAEIRVGQWALALGRGFGGQEPSISAGIISGLNRKSGVAVQTDAKLSPANFGGPLVDVNGRVIGLAVPMGMGGGAMAGVEWYDSGIGFAIPHAQVASSAESLAVGHNLRRGLLGIQLNPHASGGVPITNMADPSPASRAGLQIGDVVLAIDDAEIGTYPDLQRLLGGRLAGERIRVKIKRGSEEMELPVVLAVPEDIGPLKPPASAPSRSETEPGDDDTKKEDGESPDEPPPPHGD